MTSGLSSKTSATAPGGAEPVERIETTDRSGEVRMVLQSRHRQVCRSQSVCKGDHGASADSPRRRHPTDTDLPTPDPTVLGELHRRRRRPRAQYTSARPATPAYLDFRQGSPLRDGDLFHIAYLHLCGLHPVQGPLRWTPPGLNAESGPDRWTRPATPDAPPSPVRAAEPTPATRVVFPGETHNDTVISIRIEVSVWMCWWRTRRWPRRAG